MEDWAAGVQARNYGVCRAPDARSVRETTWIVSSMLVIAGVLLFYSWVRNQMINQGYAEQMLQEQEAGLLLSERQLVLEEQTLKNLDRIDTIARNDLKMVPVQPGQVIAAQWQDNEFAPLALAGPSKGSPESKRFSATN
jgi:cell division protein FtsL